MRVPLRTFGALCILAALVAAGAPPPAAAAPLPEPDAVFAGWHGAFFASGSGPDPAARDRSVRFLAGTHEFPIIVWNGLGGDLRNVTLVVEAPRQPFALTIEGPDPADSRPNGTKPYAFWPVLADNETCPCGFVVVHSKHSDHFGGGFHFVAHLQFETPNGTQAYAQSTLVGHLEGGRLEAEPWQAWLVGAVLVAALGAALWARRKRT